MKQLILEKVVPIQGDLVLKHLGMTPEDRKLLTEEVEVILNCAASVNFNEPLRDALQINYFGSLRVLDLAHECKKLICMTHVSSTFVNSNQEPGTTITEELHESSVDPESYITSISEMNPQALE
jgi:fatty acyl-CoA reductase